MDILCDFVDFQLSLLFHNCNTLVEKFYQFFRQSLHIIEVVHIDSQFDFLGMLSVDGVNGKHEGVSQVLQISSEVFSLLVYKCLFLCNLVFECADFLFEGIYALVNTCAHSIIPTRGFCRAVAYGIDVVVLGWATNSRRVV